MLEGSVTFSEGPDSVKTEISVFENISQKLRRWKTIETQHTETF